jgi:hypothetical protein
VRALRGTLWYGFLADIRYPANYLAEVLSASIFLALLILGGRVLGVMGIEGVIFITFVLLAGMQGPSRALEAAWTEPEEVYLHPMPTLIFLTLQAIAQAVRILLNFSVVYLVLLIPLNMPLSTLADLWRYAPIALLAGLGPGLLLAGLTLVFKRTLTLVNLLVILSVSTAYLPSAWLGPVGQYLPLTAVQGLIRGTTEPATALFVTGIFLILGVLAYHGCERLVVRSGLSGVR